MASTKLIPLSIDWNKEDADALVPLNNHHLSLFLSARGPPRDANDPAIIIEAGMGDGLRSWTAVQTLVSKFARVYSYDRANAGRSSSSPDPRSGTNIASQLSDLLETANIPPPYIIICHSYGGLLAREFLAIRPDDVVGIIFVDTVTETMSEDLGRPWEAMFSILGQMDFYAVTGLDDEHKLHPDDWAAMKAEQSRNGAAGDKELEADPQTIRDLMSKDQFEKRVLKDYPVVVIKGFTSRDFQKIYDAGVKAGNGTEEQRVKMKKTVENMDAIQERLVKEQLRLSSKGWYLTANNSGHNVMHTEPELIANEAKKVLQTLGYVSS